MTSLPHAEHAVRRKAYAPHYNLPHLTQFQPEVNDSVIKVINVSHVLLSSVPPGETATYLLAVVDPGESAGEDVRLLSRVIPPPHGRHHLYDSLRFPIGCDR